MNMTAKHQPTSTPVRSCEPEHPVVQTDAQSQADAGGKPAWEFNSSVFDALPAHIAVLDKSGRILLVNEAWRKFARENGNPPALKVSVGANYFDVCRDAAHTGDPDAQRALTGLEHVLQERIERFRMEYPCHSPTEQRWFVMDVARHLNADGSIAGVVVRHDDISARIQNEQDERIQKQRLRLALDSAALACWDWDLQSNQALWDDRLYQMLGLQRGGPDESIKSEVFFKLVHPDDLPALQQAITRSIHDDLDLDVEFRIVRPDGEERWLTAAGKVLREISGKPLRMIGVNSDITHRKRSEQALRENEMRFRLALRATNDAIWDVDLITGQVWWNRAYERNFGHRPRETSHSYDWWLEHLHPADLARVQASFKETLASREETWTARYRYRREDGTYAQVLDRAYIARDSAGKALRMIGAMQDQTSQLEYEHRLRRNADQISRQLAEIETVYSGAPVGLCVLDTQLRFVRVNQKMAEINGAPVHAHLGRTVREILPELADSVEPMLRNILQTGVPLLNYEIRGQTPAQPGVERIWLESFLPIRNESGQVLGINIVIEEVTQRKQAELALAESEWRLQQALEAGRAFAFEWQPRTDRVIRSAHCGLILGFDDREAVCDTGSGFFQKVHPEDREAFVKLVSSLSVAQPTYTTHYRLIRPDGVVVILEEKARGHFDEQGRLTRLVGVTSDVTQREHMFAKLRESEERFRQMADHAPMIIWVADEEGRASFVNRAWSELTGLAGHEALGQGWQKVVHPDDLAANAALVQRARSRQEPIRVEYRLRRFDGEYRWMIDNAMPRRGPQGEFLGYIGSVADITEMKRTQEALRQLTLGLEKQVEQRTAVAEQRAQQLRRLAMEMTQVEQRERKRLAGLLHDHLQQIIAAAKMSLAPVRAQFAKDSRGHGQVDRVIELLSDAIEVSRSLSRQLSPAILHDAGLAAALHWLGRHVQEQYKIHVDVHADDRANPECETTAVILFEAVRELLFNVVKHARVTTARLDLQQVSDDMLALSVSDQGVGLPANFETSDNGFGLFSIRERLEYLGGRMEVHSAPNQGTRITLYAHRTSGAAAIAPPDQDADLLPAVDQLPAAKPEAQKKVRVLVVDDHETLRRGLIRLLEDEGDLEVVGEASGGMEAIELACKLQPDAVLMDVSMPGMDGITATRILRREAPKAVVFGLSMHENLDMERSMRDAGAAGYFTKAGSFEHIPQALRSAAGHA